MGRKRKDDSLGLPRRVYLRHGAFYYAHPDGKWERLGTDLAKAIKQGNLYNDPTGGVGTVGYWLGQFLAHCRRRIGLPKKRRGISQRTYDDYASAVEPLKAYFGRMLPHQVEAHHVGEYLDLSAEADRAVRGNREMAVLSAAFTWMMRKPDAGVRANPCFGVERNPESKRDRYVEHDEYAAVSKIAMPSVRAFMELIYRTLQRPEDILDWGAANIVRKREPGGEIRKVLRNDQGKTGKVVDILLTPDLDELVRSLLPADGSLPGPGYRLIHTRQGEPYTYDGISAMLRRYVNKCIKAGRLSGPMGFYDLKGKGATDMWLSGVPLEKIQVLCGHESVKTTEIYVKARWRGTVDPNSTPSVAVQ